MKMMTMCKTCDDTGLMNGPTIGKRLRTATVVPCYDCSKGGRLKIALVAIAYDERIKHLQTQREN